jgi:peptide/nickel transport system ATP-binding protein/oligopeptide transport system ATP-binding protein
MEERTVLETVESSNQSTAATAGRSSSSDLLLDVQNLHVQFTAGGNLVHAVDGVSFTLKRGEVFGLVGESGCGKSATLRALIGLLPQDNAHTSGHVYYGGRDLLALGSRALRRVRGADISMIFQDPMTYLNPVLRVEEQIEEALRQHTTLGRRARRQRAVELLRLVGIPLPERRLREYPHQFSGGMRQRVLIAIALACSPKILLADEPTTALDVTIQDQILKLLLQLRAELGMSIILVSHDLSVIAQTCERVAVMYAGQIVETAPARGLIRRPKHPYAVGLLNSLPSVDSGNRYLQPIPGAPPSLMNLPAGCRFYERCPLHIEECRTWETRLLDVDAEHRARCLRHELVERGYG